MAEETKQEVVVNPVQETAIRLMSGILSNPNYNFDGAQKAASIAVDHAKALLGKFTVGVAAISVEEAAKVVEVAAGKVKEAAAKVKESVVPKAEVK